MFGELINEEKFYYNNEKIYYSLGMIVLFLVLILCYFTIKKWNIKRKRINTINGNLVYKRTILHFDKKSIDIVNLLLKSEKEIISKDIMEIVENPNHNRSAGIVLNGKPLVLVENMNGETELVSEILERVSNV